MRHYISGIFRESAKRRNRGPPSHCGPYVNTMFLIFCLKRLSAVSYCAVPEPRSVLLILIFLTGNRCLPTPQERQAC
jgi:hypothetical protein